jgi:HEAT repeat protein
MPGKTSFFGNLIALLALALVPTGRAVAFPDPPPPLPIELIDSPMYTSPDLPKPDVEWVFPEVAIKLWLAALERPEAEMKCKAADAITRAHKQGVKGLESAVARLLSLFEQPGQHPAVRLAAVRALVTMDVRQTAPRLFDHLQTVDADVRDWIEPSLARWDYRPMRAVWLGRLSQTDSRSRQLVLAMQGLAEVREEEAVAPLRKIVLSDRTETTLRMEAARALGRIRDSGMEKDAELLCKEQSTAVAHLCAVRMLDRHASQEAVQLLQRLMSDNEPAVAAAAIERLIALNARNVVPKLDSILASADPQLRSLGIDALLRQPSAKHIDMLSERLDDPHPDVRGKARQALLKLAGQKPSKDRVIMKATEVLATRRWRALEQAALLLAQLDHKPAAARMLELLDFDRDEVFVAAAWGLRKLAVPETVPAVVRQIKANSFASDKQAARARHPDWADIGVSQLIQFVGMQKEPSADELWRAFIPRPMGSNLTVAHESRAAAIWSLGLLHEGKELPDLESSLVQRLDDVRSIPPEDFRVRWMSAYSLGRMKTNSALPSLRMHYVNRQPSDNPVSNACGWAIEQITGEKMAAPQTVRKPQRDWFLIPRK